MASANIIAILTVSAKVKFIIKRGAEENSTTFTLRRYVDERAAQVEDLSDSKNVELTMSRFKILMNSVERMERALERGEKDQYQLGGNYFLTFDSTFISVRKFVFNHNTNRVFPTKEGVSLTHYQFSALKELFKEVEDVHAPEIKHYVPCPISPSHANQLGYLSCAECCPNTYIGY